MRVWQAIVAFVAMALLTLPAFADSTQGISATTITIGNLGPFSGPASVFTPLNYGPEAYLRYINDQGGVNGRKFVTVFADDSCNEAKGIAAAKKLIYEDKVFMIMANPCSGVAMAIKPMLVQEGVPWMGASANPKISSPASPGIFHAVYPGSESGRAMATFAHEQTRHHQDRAGDAQRRLGARLLRPCLGLREEPWRRDRRHDDAGARRDGRHGAGAADQGIRRPGGHGLPVSAGTRRAAARSAEIPDQHRRRCGALGADFDQVLAAFPSHDWLQGHFFQPYQFKAKLGTGPLKKFHDIFVKYLTKDELPKTGEPTNFYYYGVPVAIVAVEAFRRAGPNPTRESWEKAVESLKDFDTGVLADTETFAPDDHVGVHKMSAVGLDAQGQETVYKTWGVPLPNSD